MQCEHIEPLISGYLDGELTQQQDQLVRVHVENCTDCHRIFTELSALKKQVAGLSYPDLHERDLARLNGLETDGIVQVTSFVGWMLIVLGCSGLATGSLLLFFQSSDAPALVKLLYGLLIVGGGSLFLSVLRQRLIERKTDKYRNVKL